MPGDLGNCAEYLNLGGMNMLSICGASIDAGEIYQLPTRLDFMALDDDDDAEDVDDEDLDVDDEDLDDIDDLDEEDEDLEDDEDDLGDDDDDLDDEEEE